MTQENHSSPERLPTESGVPSGTVPAALGRPVARRDGPRRSAEATTQSFSVWVAWDAIRFGWKWALPSGLLMAGVAAAVIFLTFKPMYEASAWLQIADARQVLVFNLESDARSQTFVNTQTELLRSPVVIGPVISTLGVRDAPEVPELEQVEDPIVWLGKEVKVAQRQQSALFTVSFRSRSPEAAAFLVNGVVTSYFKLQDQQEAIRIQAVIVKLNEVNSGKSEEIKQLRSSLTELASKSPETEIFLPLSKSVSLARTPLSDLQNRIIVAEVEEKTLEARLQVLEESTAKHPVVVPSSLLEKAVAESSDVKQLAADFQAGTALLKDMESRVVKGQEDPLYQKARAELQQQEKLLETLRQEVRIRTAKGLESSLSGLRNEELATMRNDLESRRLAKKYLLEQREKELRSAQKDTGIVLTLKTKKDELDRSESVHDAISDRILKLRTEQSAPARVTLLQSADVPKTPVKQWPWQLLMVPGLFALPFGLAVLKEQLASRVRDVRGIEQQMHLAVLGEITRPPEVQVGRPTVGTRRTQRSVRLMEESIDSLRTRLFVSEDFQNLRFLAVTSAARHEGKTSVAVQLAASIARATHQPTLLIDGDLRAPSTHQVFQVERGPGLVDVLTGASTLHEAIQATWLENLHLLSAGNLEGSPHHLLGDDSFRTLLQSIPASYHHVIIDTPPVLAASESLILAKDADACLLCVMRDVSRAAQAKMAGDRLVAAGARLAGVVVNGVPSGQYLRRYGQYAYGYYSD
jgi:succinoglycan biosynthesis transport protein ExoP